MLSHELAELVGAPAVSTPLREHFISAKRTLQLPRHEVVKKIWDYIKTHDVRDPKNKAFVVCDERLEKVFSEFC